MLKRIISGSDHSKNVFTLISGTAISQLIPVIATPWLTRLYTPADFGIFALYLGIVSTIAIVATGRYEMAIMLPKDKEDAINLAALSLLVALGMGLFSLLVILILNSFLYAYFVANGINGFVFLVPLSVLFIGIYQTFNFWCSRNKQFKKIASTRIVENLSLTIISILLGWLSPFKGGMIIGLVSGQFLSATAIGFTVLREDAHLIKSISGLKMKTVAKEYKDFPLVNSLQNLVDMIQKNGTVILIGYYFGNTVLGFYSLSFRLLRAPLAVIGSAFIQVFYQQASELYNKGREVATLFKKTILNLVKIALPVFILLFFFSPFLFKIIFGIEWQEAGVMARIMIPWLCINFIVSPVSHFPMILNQQKRYLTYNIAGNFSGLFVIWISSLLTHNVNYSLSFFTLVMSVYTIVLYYWIRKLAFGVKAIEEQAVTN